MISLRQRIQLIEAPATELNAIATKYHYLHRPVHQRASPFGWKVIFDNQPEINGEPCGIIMFSSIHFVKLRGFFGYPGLPTCWQCLSFSRLWVSDFLPRNSESCIIGKAMRLVQRRWLEVHPPRYLDRPYHIELILSYSDTRYHVGTVYRAANFQYAGQTIGRPRHKNKSRGPGTEDAVLLRFVYRLARPRWVHHPAAGLPLFKNQQPHARATFNQHSSK